MAISGLLKKIGCTAMILGSLLGAPKKADALDLYLYGYFGADVNLFQEATIQTIPESIRDVPAHTSDSWVPDENVAPIKDSSLKLSFPTISILKGELGVGIKEGRLDFKIGPEFAIAIGGGTSNLVERNYTNFPGTDKRGYGAALTYYRLRMDNIEVFVPGISAKASLSLFTPEEMDKFFSNLSFMPKKLCETTSYPDKTTGYNLFVKYSASFWHYPFYFETGWDRWDSLETYKEYGFSVDVINHTISAGIDMVYDESNTSIRLFAGLTLPQIIKKDPFANEVGLTISPSLYLGTGIDLNSNTDKK